VEVSANRLARARRKVFAERPEKYLLIGAPHLHAWSVVAPGNTL
jgi:hypothetical protein